MKMVGRGRSPARLAKMVAGVLLATISVVAAGCSVAPGASPRPTDSAVVPAITATAIFPVVADPAAPLRASDPVRLQIPTIKVDSTLMALGLAADGTMEVPPRGFPAGWYTGAPTPGEMGPAIIVGHVDWAGPAVFYKLDKLVVGDDISVTRQDGSIANFTVTDVEEYSKAAFPTMLVYGGLDYAGLRLITCGGAFNHKTGHYVDNIVVFARLTSSSAPAGAVPPPPVVTLPPPGPHRGIGPIAV